MAVAAVVEEAVVDYLAAAECFLLYWVRCWAEVEEVEALEAVGEEASAAAEEEVLVDLEAAVVVAAAPAAAGKIIKKEGR